MLKLLPKIVFLLTLFFLGCGCWSFRYSAVADIHDINDNISTKYRYRCAGIRRSYTMSRNNKCDINEILNRNLEKCYPNVFSNSGISFTMLESVNGGEFGASWPQIFTILTQSIFPKMHKTSLNYRYHIGMVEDASIKTHYDMRETTESASGLFPTAWLFLCGEPQSNGNRSYCYRDKDVGKTMESDFYDCTEPALDRFLRLDVFAYAVASKLKELEDSGKIDQMLKRQEEAKNNVPPHRILKLIRDASVNFKYEFLLELSESPSNPERTLNMVLDDLSKSVKEEYMDTYPNVSAASLVTDCSDVKIDGKRIEGHIAILTITPVSLIYDPNTRKGKLAVRFNANQYEEARKWIRKNIETLVRDKNIALVTGQVPPDARFYLGREEVKEGNVLEIEFSTE